jgi:hypothetical protein
MGHQSRKPKPLLEAKIAVLRAAPALTAVPDLNLMRLITFFYIKLAVLHW